MTSIVFDPNGTKVTGPTQESSSFLVSIQDRSESSTLVSRETYSLFDAEITKDTFGVPVPNFKILVEPLVPSSTPTKAIFKSFDPNVQVDIDGNVALLNGRRDSIDINISFGRIERTFNFTRAIPFQPLVTSYVSKYYENSLAKHIYDSTAAILDSALAQGIQPQLNAGNSLCTGLSQELWVQNSHDPISNNAIKNTNFFANSLANKFLCLSVGQYYNNLPTQMYPGVLISRRHIYSANHWHPGTIVGSNSSGVVGTKLAFMRPDGSKQEVSILSFYGDSGSDSWIAYLSEDIDPLIPHAKVMPNTWPAYIKSTLEDLYPVDTGAPPYGFIPTFSKVIHNQKGLLSDRVSIQLIQSINDTSVITAWPYEIGTYPIDVLPSKNLPSTFAEKIRPWGGAITGGDSGGAHFVLVNGELVLIKCNFTASGGADIASVPWIEQKMRDLAQSQGDGRYFLLDRVDISMFTPYSTIDTITPYSLTGYVAAGYVSP